MENGFSDRTRRPMRWLLRKLGHGLPPLPTVGGRALATRVAGLLLVGGAILIVVTVALPPAAEGSDMLILGYGAVAAVAGVWLLSTRRASEPVLGGAAALGTLIITLATLEGGPGRGTGDNEVLYLWISLFAFWFLGLRHALLQLALIGVGDALFLGDQAPSFAAGLTRWVVTMATLLITGLLMAWIRRSLEREREETARLAVVAERMRIARDLHDAAGHGVTAISLQAAAAERVLDEDGDTDEARSVLEEIKRTSRTTLEDMRKLLGLLRPGDAPDPDRDRVSLSHLDEMIEECRAAGLTVTVERSEDPALGPWYWEPTCCYTTGVGFMSIATLLSLLALAGMADADDSQPTAYQAAVHLASKIGSRPSASPNERRAHQYVARQLRTSGLETSVNPFRVKGRGRSQNVIGKIDGRGSCLVILMAHTDSVPPGHGAIDNASGVGVLVALAPRLASLDPACDVWLVATGSEEREVTGLPYHTGAAALVKQVKSEGRAGDLRFALSVDEVGLGKRFHLRSPVSAIRGAIEGQILSASRRAGVTVHWARDSGTGNSDHREFELAGLPGAVLEVWKGVFPCHHMACDRPRLLQKLAMKKATRILEELIRGI